MVRICHVQVLPLLSGVQRSMLETLRHLDPTIFESAVVCQSEGPLTEELERRGIEFHLVPELGRDIRPWRDMRAYWALRRLFANERFDLVHNQSAKPRVVAGLAARHAGVRVVINHVRGYSFHERTPRLRRAVYQRIEAWAARQCQLTLFVNHEDREYAIAKRLALREQCQTIYNGADLVSLTPLTAPGRRHELRMRLGWKPGEVVIAVLGRLEEQKQPLILPKIARRLESFHPSSPWRICVVGDGHLGGELEQAVSECRVKHRMQLLGWQDSPINILHACDVVLLPSLWEGLPRVLIEAQAAGLPCVASDIRGNREVLSTDTGVLVEVESVTAYAAALTRLIESPFLRAQLGQAARRRAERLFDSDRNNLAIIRIYCELLDIPIPQRLLEAA